MIKESCGVLKIWHKENRQCKNLPKRSYWKMSGKGFFFVNCEFEGSLVLGGFFERCFSLLLFIYNNVHVCVVYTSLCIISAASLGLGLVSVWCNVWSHPLSQFLYWSLINTVRIIPYNQIILASLSTRVSI